MPVDTECELRRVKPAIAAGGMKQVAMRNGRHRSEEDHHRLSGALQQTRIIPAVRAPEFLARSACAPGKVVHFLFGNPEHIAEMVEVVASHGKAAMVSVDLAAGLSRDEAAISFLAHRQVQGIISTHVEPLRAARDFGLFAIKRTFLLDSAALDSALHSLDQFVPDALEVMPGLAAPHIIPRLRQHHPDLLVIAGGLVSTLREIEQLVEQGVTSVSVSDHRLWVA